MKTARHAMILDLIGQYDIETQDELAERLKQHNYSVTQATVSRDIKELRLIKALSDNGAYKYAAVDKAETGLQECFISIFSQAVLNITSAGNIIVIKTISGSASAAAEAVDSLKWKEIAGSIAGDNTIFIAVKDGRNTPELIKRFQALIKV
ncbi:MAG: arginine repressor [Clostridiales bacterium]|jgi:transcriptional regulator of arginine metabolism|nr:arginine repressor [Clostridiales bacterium]